MNKKLLWGLLIIVLGIAGIVLRIVSAGVEQQRNQQIEVKEDTLTAEVSGRKLENEVRAGGSLTEDAVCGITIPDGVMIREYLVKTGDVVKEGDVIAAVDENSVILAITAVQDLMGDLDERLEEEMDSDSTAVTAAGSGRVKAVLIEAGSSVTDTLRENGAVMLLSLDGLMAADIESDANVSAGDQLKVTLSDGTELTGRVSQVREGGFTVTISDQYGDYEEQAAVADQDGNTLGTGSLYISTAN